MIEDTICAPATSPVNSSIAIIRISGPESLRVIDSITNLNQEFQSRHAYLTSIISNNTLIDDVIVIIYRSPGSFTGENMAEIFCHGNPLIVQKIITLLYSYGIKPAEPGEFSKRAFLNGKIDLTEAEAINHIITAKSDWEIETSLKQMHGSLKAIIDKIREDIIEFKADIEAGIDFSDEEIDFISNDTAANKLKQILTSITDLQRRCSIGNTLSHGIDVTITGKPNVGKSSILNLILNQERAIVSNIPGTTRDIIRETLQINGIHINLYDTAGIDQPGDEIEKIGIDLSRKKIESASIILMVIDSTSGIQNADLSILNEIIDKQKIILLNKTDIAEKKELESIINKLSSQGNENIILFSAKTGRGLDELNKKITDILKTNFTDIDTSFIADLRIINLLTDSTSILHDVLSLIKNNEPNEIIAFETQALLDCLSEITGEIKPDSILDSIFSRFCIGK